MRGNSHIVANRGYGDGTELLAGYAGVGEIWGNFFGADCGRAEFGGGLGQGRFDSDEDWYEPGFYMHLHDDYGVTERELYACLQSDINSIPDFRNNLINKYPYISEEIRQIISIYE